MTNLDLKTAVEKTTKKTCEEHWQSCKGCPLALKTKTDTTYGPERYECSLKPLLAFLETSPAEDGTPTAPKPHLKDFLL